MFFYKHKDANLYENKKCIIEKTQIEKKKQKVAEN